MGVHMDNERRADIGESAVYRGASMTGVHEAECVETAITDVLAYIAHFCARCQLDASITFARALNSYREDAEDGPFAEQTIDPADRLADVSNG